MCVRMGMRMCEHVYIGILVDYFYALVCSDVVGHVYWAFVCVCVSVCMHVCVRVCVRVRACVRA